MEEEGSCLDVREGSVSPGVGRCSDILVGQIRQPGRDPPRALGTRPYGCTRDLPFGLHLQGPHPVRFESLRTGLKPQFQLGHQVAALQASAHRALYDMFPHLRHTVALLFHKNPLPLLLHMSSSQLSPSQSPPRWQTFYMASTSSSTAPPCRPHCGETSHFALLSPCSPPLPSCSGTSPPCQLFPPCCSGSRSSAPSTTTPSPGCAGLRPGDFTSSSGKLSYSHNFVGGGPRRIYSFSSSNFSCLAVIVTSNPVPCSRV